MFTERRIERHQLPYYLKVFNRITDKPIGYLGNVSFDGLMLISQIPMLVGAQFELRLKILGAEGHSQFIDINAVCQWSNEDAAPGNYDSGFVVASASADYQKLVEALYRYFSFYSMNASA